MQKQFKKMDAGLRKSHAVVGWQSLLKRGGEGGPYKDTQPLSPKHIMNIAWRASGHGGGDHTVIISYFCEFVI